MSSDGIGCRAGAPCNAESCASEQSGAIRLLPRIVRHCGHDVERRRCRMAPFIVGLREAKKTNLEDD